MTLVFAEVIKRFSTYDISISSLRRIFIAGLASDGWRAMARDWLMIVCGLVGALVQSRYKWGYYALASSGLLSVICFIANTFQVVLPSSTSPINPVSKRVETHVLGVRTLAVRS